MKKLVLLIAIALCSVTAFSQGEEETGKKAKFFAGGGFGLTLGRFTFINLNPQVGYRFNRFVAAGLGLNLAYASQKEDSLSYDYYKRVQGIIGLNAFVRLYPVRQFFIQLQPEENYMFGKEIFYRPTKQVFKSDAILVPSVLIGGGLAMPTAKGAVMTTLLYDILQNPDSPYGNRPVVNVGYVFNF